MACTKKASIIVSFRLQAARSRPKISLFCCGVSKTISERRAIRFYHSYNKEGFLRHLVLRQAFATNEILVNLVTTSACELDQQAFVDMVLALSLSSEIAGILHTINNSPSDAVKPERVELLYGKDFIIESLCGLDFQISPFSFFQTNTHGAESALQQSERLCRGRGR